MSRPAIHLVTYASYRFRLRQLVLGASAKINGVVDSVSSWNPEKLRKAGFEERCKDVKLSELGSGFWAWKPFIIQKKLSEVSPGDLVFYCDVGRNYPFKKLEFPVHSYLDWMIGCGQSVMPGVQIPWKGPMSMWTKREAFAAMDMDQPKFHGATPIQASFSFWRKDEKSLEIADEWMALCARRNLISDDPSHGGFVDLPDFHENRYDQSLLSLCCMKHGIHGIDLGNVLPSIDTQHPVEVQKLLYRIEYKIGAGGRLLKSIVRPIEWLEEKARKKVKFGEPRYEPEFIHHDPNP